MITKENSAVAFSLANAKPIAIKKPMHLILKTTKLPNRAAYFAFIKTVTAALINYLSKALGKNLKGLFDLRPYTKIITCRNRRQSYGHQIPTGNLVPYGNKKTQAFRLGFWEVQF
jgi:hypothetical protein